MLPSAIRKETVIVVTGLVKSSSHSFSVTNTAWVDDNTNILLQTVRVIVKNCKSSYENSVQVLFDSCSQLS